MSEHTPEETARTICLLCGSTFPELIKAQRDELLELANKARWIIRDYIDTTGSYYTSQGGSHPIDVFNRLNVIIRQAEGKEV